MIKLAIVLLLVQICLSADIYVSPSGTDSPGCGAQKAAPCKSLYFAVSISSSGDSILLAPGRYQSNTFKTTISHNLSIGPSVPQEGPPIIDFDFTCLPNGQQYSIAIANYTSAIQVTFNHITFSNLVCRAQSGVQGLPSIISIQSQLQTGSSSVHVNLFDVTFENNLLNAQANQLTSGTPFPGLVYANQPVGKDPITVNFANSLFSINNAIGVAAYGQNHIAFSHLGVYNTSFYAFPSIYLVGASLVNISQSAFVTNQITDTPLASFLYVNSSNQGALARVIVFDSYFKDSFSPAIRVQGQISLAVSKSAFYDLSNSAFTREVVPPYAATATAISCVDDATVPTSTLNVTGSYFSGMGYREANNVTAAIGVSGLAQAFIANNEFLNSDSIGFAVLYNGAYLTSLVISSNVFTNSASRAIVLTCTGSNINAPITITNCTFTNVANQDTEFKSAIFLNTFGITALSSASATINECRFSTTQVGLFAGQYESVNIVKSTFASSVPVSVHCLNHADVSVQNSSGFGATQCSQGCSLTNNGKSVCQ